jgi:hypothetical protein
MKRYLAPIFLIAACVGDASLPYILGFVYPSFSQSADVISILGEPNSPVQTLFNQLSIVTGSLFVLGALGLPGCFKQDHNRLAINLMSVSIGTYGLFDCVLSGLVVINDRETSLVAALISGWLAKERGQMKWATFFWTCLTLGSLCIVFFLSYYVPFLHERFATTRGLWQRASLFFLYSAAIGVAQKAWSTVVKKDVYQFS